MSLQEAISARREFQRGVRLVLPVLPGTAAWGLVSGIAMLKTGLTSEQAFAMTLLMYAGSAQLACLPLIAAAAPVFVTLLTAAIVNLRFLIYGLGLASAFRGESRWMRLLLGYLNADPGYILFTPRRDEDTTRPHARSLYLGITVGNWITWQTSSLLGIALGARIPTTWGLELAGVLALIALAIPLITTLPTVAGCLAASVIALLGAQWPLRLGIIGAVVAGVTVAMIVETATTEAATNPRVRPRR
jgi:predicted branched-subunit amino acid permease